MGLKLLIMKQEQFLGVVRHSLTFIGGLLVTKGLIDEATSAEIIGTVVTLIGTIWSIIKNAKAAV